MFASFNQQFIGSIRLFWHHYICLAVTIKELEEPS